MQEHQWRMHEVLVERCRGSVVVVAAIVMAVVLWLLVRVVLNPLDAKRGG